MMLWLRRIFWLTCIGGGGYAAWSAWSARTERPESAGASDWPPLDPEPEASNVIDSVHVAPSDDGSCPIDHPVKANSDSMIYHTPSGRMYERTNADRCYLDPGSAEADGYRASKV